MSALSNVKRMLPTRVKNVLKAVTGRDSMKSYSQFGEDAFVAAHFRGKTWTSDGSSSLPDRGFYVDIGAYSPTECSNTYTFYRHGWRGINIEASPGVISSFTLIRPRDINLNLAVSKASGSLTFFSWGSPSVFNTADPRLAEERARDLGVQPETATVRSMPLREVLDQHLPAGTKIDFLSVDVEGLDLEVLESNDWTKYRPELVIAEVYAPNLDELRSSGLYAFMTGEGYKCIAWLNPSVVFRDVSPGA